MGRMFRWLAGKPKPVQLPPRIVIILMVGFWVALRVLPPEPTLAVLRVTTPALVVMFVVLFAAHWAWCCHRRGRGS